MSWLEQHSGMAQYMPGGEPPKDVRKGFVTSWGERKHSVYMTAPGANDYGWLGSYYLRKDADEALEVYRMVMGRHPKTGELV